MLKNARTYGNELNSYDVLKLAALLAMIIDHAGAYFWPHAEALRVIGRAAFPLFLFLVGYSGKWKVSPGFLLLAALVALCGAFTHHPLFPLNILVTIACVRVAMRLVTRRQLTQKYLGMVFAVAVVWMPLFLWLDYSTLALLFALSGYLMRHGPDARESHLFFYATLALHFAVEWFCFQFSLPAAFCMLLILLSAARLLRGFRLRAYAAALPVGVILPLQWAARNTLPLYAMHVMAFMVLEKWIFPERLAHFQWI